MHDQATRQQALEIAYRVLAELERQAAGYTTLDIPTDLIIKRDDKRKEVKYLEGLLRGKVEGFPSTLPRPQPFFGREKEIELALEALSPKVRVYLIGIDGIGGMGKTALAIEIADKCRERNLFDVFLFSTAKRTQLNNDGESSIPGAAFTLADMVADLSYPLGESQITHLIDTESDQDFLRFLQAFSGPDRRVLLVLDNLETFADADYKEITRFLSFLPQSCKAIITTRRKLGDGDGGTWLRLEGLELEDTRNLIRDSMQRAPNLRDALVHVDSSDLNKLHEATGGSPLALNRALALMSKRNLDLNGILRLQDTGPSGNAPFFEFVYREAQQELDADEWLVLGALTISHRAKTLDDIRRDSKLNASAAESALERLYALSLVNVQAPGGPFSLHPLTRQLVQNELASNAEFLGAVFPPSILPPSSNLVGRDAALKDIKGLLAGAGYTNIVVVRGWPGVGKSAVVHAIGRDPDVLTMFPQGVLWTSLEQRPNLLSEMARWGRALGTDEILRAPTLWEATAQLKALLQHRRMLLILDDVWETAHAIPFTEVLGNQCALLVTTRLTSVAEELTTDENRRYVLPVLSEDDSLELLRTRAPEIVQQHQNECRELVRDLECLPLALLVAGGLLRSEAKLGWGVADLINEIREGARLMPESAPNDRLEGKGIPTLSALLMKSTNMLDEFTRDCFAFLGAFAPKPATFDLEAMQAVWEVDDAKPIVRELVGHGLLEPAGSGRFQIHRILVDHARSLCGE